MTMMPMTTPMTVFALKLDIGIPQKHDAPTRLGCDSQLTRPVVRCDRRFIKCREQLT